ncbi:MAG: metallophosphoesterase [Acidobacteriota bacterium]|nr:metallophosphoesterase [Acidobacteriota bacterium]
MRFSYARNLIGAAAMAVVGLTATAATASAEGRVVAIGDVHGAYDQLVAILQRAELIDAETHWIGGEATLVQTGDLFDRGLQVRDVMDLLMTIQTEAAAAGGQVIVLLGNHEGMNLTGFYRDVNPDIYATFADDKSKKRRKSAFARFQKYWHKAVAAAGYEPQPMTGEIKQQWMTAHPLGRVEYTEAIGPDGVYGKWLRTLPIAVVIDDVLFIHGGIGPALAGVTVDEINQRAAEEMAVYDSAREYLVNHGLMPTTLGLDAMVTAARKQNPPEPALAALLEADSWMIRSGDGPLWFRGSAKWDEDEQGEEMVELLAGVGAQFVVGGHTPQRPRRIQTRFDGRVFLIDTGMLSSHYEDGQPSALVIEGDTFTAIYLDDSEVVETRDVLPAAA